MSAGEMPGFGVIWVLHTHAGAPGMGAGGRPQARAGRHSRHSWNTVLGEQHAGSSSSTKHSRLNAGTNCGNHSTTGTGGSRLPSGALKPPPTENLTSRLATPEHLLESVHLPRATPRSVCAALSAHRLHCDGALRPTSHGSHVLGLQVAFNLRVLLGTWWKAPTS